VIDMDAGTLAELMNATADWAGHVLALVQTADPETAPVAPVETATTLPAGGAEAFSFFQLFLKADIIGKSVMIGLVVLSFWSWAIIVDKFVRLRTLNSKADIFEDTFWSGRSLEDLYQTVGNRPDHPFAVVFVSAMREWKRSFEGGTVTASMAPSIKDRIDRVMNVTIGRETAEVEKRLGFLATVGSTAPFIGLFGTVWGIMNAFRAIAVQQNPGLQVVAPGIAEALFATALGLLAAIPAVIAYNRFISDANRYAGRLEGFADEFSAILSRQLDERAK
jgi:biopolymer transport protein TolQ